MMTPKTGISLHSLSGHLPFSCGRLCCRSISTIIFISPRSPRTGIARASSHNWRSGRNFYNRFNFFAHYGLTGSTFFARNIAPNDLITFLAINFSRLFIEKFIACLIVKEDGIIRFFKSYNIRNAVNKRF